jgi:type I restriction enzyme, S subunit
VKNWKTVKLGDVAEVAAGGSAPQGSEFFGKEGKPFVRAGSLPLLLKGVNESSLEHLTEDVARLHRLQLFPKHTVLFAKSGMSATKGHIYQLKQPSYVVNHLAAIVPKKDLDSNYFRYWIHVFSPSRLIQDAAYPSIRLSDIVEIKIPLPPLDEQKRIAAVLDKANQVREKRRAAVKKLDALLQSVFLDMFGDPVNNPKGWEVATVGKYAKLQGGYAFKSNDYVNDSNVKLVKISNVHYENLTWEDIDLLPESYLNKYSDFSLKNGDIVVSLTRPIIKSLDSVKVAQVTNEDLPCLLNQRVGRFIIKNPDILSDLFLLYFCYSKHFKIEVAKYCSESLQPNVSNKQIEDIKMILPPISLQLKFAEVVGKIKKLNKTATNGHLQSEKLFQSLQQRAFAGELFGANDLVREANSKSSV